MIPVLYALLFALLTFGSASSAEFKVLVVMSYEEDNPWVKEIREGIEIALRPSSDITYFYMNTKVAANDGPRTAQQAFTLYQSLQPNGVITADDDAQSMFVLPFLKDKVSTPIMFNGVNADAQAYGFPTPHISGVLERAHVRESLAFMKQLVPSIQTVCFITNNVPSGRALRAQVESEKASYPARVGTFYLVQSISELTRLEQPLRADCSAVFVDSLEGIVDTDSRPLNNHEVLDVLTKVYDGPLLAGNRYQVEQGAWAAVIKTGQEQGETSGEMLFRAMRGTPVAEIPITRNMRGQRVINISALEAHGIELRPTILRGAKLVRQEP